MAVDNEWRALPNKLLANCVFNYNVPPIEQSGLPMFLGKFFFCIILAMTVLEPNTGVYVLL